MKCLAFALLALSCAAPAQERAQLGHSQHGEHQQQQEHEGHDHGAMEHGTRSVEPREPIPPLTDADRAAAFPALSGGHPAHDRGTHIFFGLDQLELREAEAGTGFAWEALGWLGGDVHRVWLRSEGERFDGRTETADLQVFAGRAIAPWWDLIAGVRHDFHPDGSQTFAGIGVIGLAPYKFEIEASAYLGEAGQTTARLEAGYELLLTNRLILQPLLEVDLYGKTDLRRNIGSGLSTLEAGARLRYEITRRFAPYVGITYERALSRTADLRRADGEPESDTLAVAGVRTWF
jgi:copper resistance protein B